MDEFPPNYLPRLHREREGGREGKRKKKKIRSHESSKVIFLCTYQAIKRIDRSRGF